MANELVLKIEEEITPQISEQIKKTFEPMVKMLSEFETRYDEVVAAGISKENCNKARRLRLDIAKVRTTTENMRKAEKAQYIRAGKAIDAVSDILKYAVMQKEEQLEKIEKHFELIEAERIAKLALARVAELAEFECYNVPGLDTMDEVIYSNFLTGAKTNFQAKKEAEQKAEAERLRLIEIEKLHNQRKELLLPVWNFVPVDKRNDNFGNLSDPEWIERYEWTLNEKKVYDEQQEKIRLENERLKKEAEEKEKQRQEEIRIAEIERKKQDEILTAEKAKAEAERKAIEEKERIKRELQSKRLNELMPFAEYGDSLDMSTLWILAESHYQEILAGKKALQEKEVAEIAEAKRLTEIEAKRLKDEQDAILEKERAERAKIEAELKAKAEAEEKAKTKIEAENKARLLAEKKAKASPDKVKLANLANVIDEITLPEVVSDEAKSIIHEVRERLNMLANYIVDSSKEL